MGARREDTSTVELKLACVDTSTFTESIALVEGRTLMGERLQFRAKGHASGLHADLRSLLSEAGWALEELDGFVCGLGPGSFTGMRVGLAAFKGLAFALGKPLCGVPTPEALLADAGHGALALIDARRGEVYAEGPLLREPVCLTPEALIERLSSSGPPPTQLIGEGALRYAWRFKEAWPEVIIAPPSAHIPRASLLAEPALKLLASHGVSAFSDPTSIATLEPIYVRPSDAEINYPEGFPSEARLFGSPKRASSSSVKGGGDA